MNGGACMNPTLATRCQRRLQQPNRRTHPPSPFRVDDGPPTALQDLGAWHLKPRAIRPTLPRSRLSVPKPPGPMLTTPKRMGPRLSGPKTKGLAIGVNL